MSERCLRGHGLLAYFNWVDGQGHADHSSMTMYKFKRITTFRLANIAHRNDGGGLNYILWTLAVSLTSCRPRQPASSSSQPRTWRRWPGQTEDGDACWCPRITESPGEPPSRRAAVAVCRNDSGNRITNLKWTHNWDLLLPPSLAIYNNHPSAWPIPQQTASQASRVAGRLAGSPLGCDYTAATLLLGGTK